MKLVLVASLALVFFAGAFADKAADEAHEAHPTEDPHAHDLDDIHVNTADPNPHVIHAHVTREVHSAEDRGRLVKKLFENYDKRNYPTNSTLKLGFSLIRFDVDEKHGTIDVDGWMREQWNDPRLTWNPSEYGGEDVVRVAVNDVWKPDITLYNSALSTETHGCVNTNVLVYNTGDVLWVPPCQFKAYCNLTLDVTPYGEQKCGLKFGSWTYDGDLLDLQFYNQQHKVDLSDFWDNSDYEITSNLGHRVVQHYSCCAEPYPYISFDFSFHRRQNTHHRCH